MASWPQDCLPCPLRKGEEEKTGLSMPEALETKSLLFRFCPFHRRAQALLQRSGCAGAGSAWYLPFISGVVSARELFGARECPPLLQAHQ